MKIRKFMHEDLLKIWFLIIFLLITFKYCNVYIIKYSQSATSNTKQGTVILNCEESSNSKESITLQLNGVKLDKKDVFGKSDPFIEIYRSNDPIKFSKGDININNYNKFVMFI